MLELLLAQLGKKRLKVQVKRSQDDLGDGEGEGGEEDNDFDESLYDAGGFATGDTSCATTRASTPRGHFSQQQTLQPPHYTGAHTQPQSHPHSHSSNESLPAVMEKVDETADANDSSPDEPNGEAQDTQDSQQQMSHNLLVNSVAAVSLSPVTPSEAEARVKRAAAVAVAASAAGAGVANTGCTTTRTATRDAVHSAAPPMTGTTTTAAGTTTTVTQVSTAPPRVTMADGKGALAAEGAGKRVVG